jgi:hypothetical protein
LRAFPVYEPEFPREEKHFRNAVPLHVPTILADHLRDLRSLLLITGIERDWIEIEFTEDEPGGLEIRRRLVEDYGWPDQFRQADWLRDKDRIWSEVRTWSRENGDTPNRGTPEIAAQRHIPRWI